MNRIARGDTESLEGSLKVRSLLWVRVADIVMFIANPWHRKTYALNRAVQIHLQNCGQARMGSRSALLPDLDMLNAAKF